MFRVLSEEEAEKVIRWKAPDLTGTAINRAKTSEWTAPIIPLSNDTRRKPTQDNQPTQDNPPTREQHPVHTSAPELQAAHQGLNLSTTSVAGGNPSVDMLQASYDDGFARGHAEGKSAVREQTEQALQQVVEAMDQIAAPMLDRAVHEEVAALSMSIARLLLNREIAIDTDAMQRLVEAGLEQLPALDATSRRVHLHPLDASLVRDALTETPGLKVIDDATMKRGDCLVSSASSKVLCGLDQWLDGMARQLDILPAEHSDDMAEQ